MEKVNTEIDEADEPMLSPEQLADEYNFEVADFFAMEPTENIEVEIFDSQADIIDFYNKTHEGQESAPDYLVGFSPGNKINIIGPSGMPADTDPGKIRFQKVLKHELVHKYLKQLEGNLPGWLCEGICCHVANQAKGTVSEEDLSIELLRELGHTQDGRKYSVGRSMVDLIVQGYGKEKLFELAKLKNQDEIYTELQRMFEWLK